MSVGDDILFETKGSTAIITLNRPENMNAFSRSMVAGLMEAVLEVKANPTSIRSLILTGAGQKAFCAGADLKERKDMSSAEVAKFLTVMNQIFVLIENLDQITLTAINGYALGGGLELALCTDFRIAAADAQVGLTETRLGIIPGGGGTQRLPRLIGIGQAKKMIYSGRRVGSEEALGMGLVDEVSQLDALLPASQEYLTQFGDAGPIALAQAKFALQKGIEVDLATGLAIEQKAYNVTLFTEDRVEALKAFKEKRKPEFKGR